MKKYQVWTEESYDHGDNDRGGMLIPVEDIENIVYTGNESWAEIQDGDIAEIDRLNDLLGDTTIDDEDDLKGFLETHGVKYHRISYPEDYQTIESELYYDYSNRCFFDLADCETYPAYRWWDGSNMKVEFVDEITTVTEVVAEDEMYHDLDTWDGNNYNAGTQFYHEAAYRVLELDGEKPTEEMFLLVEWSQYQGDHDTGRILTAEELAERIEEVGA